MDTEITTDATTATSKIIKIIENEDCLCKLHLKVCQAFFCSSFCIETIFIPP